MTCAIRMRCVGGGDGGGEDIGVKVWDERANSLYRCRITG